MNNVFLLIEYFVFLWWPFPKSTQTLVHDIDIKIWSNYIGNFTREFLPIIIDRIESPRFTLRFLVRIILSWTESCSSSLLTTPLKIPLSKISLSRETDETCNCFELCALIQCNFCVFGTAMADFQIVTILADFLQFQLIAIYNIYIWISFGSKSCTVGGITKNCRSSTCSSPHRSFNSTTYSIYCSFSV